MPASEPFSSLPTTQLENVRRLLDLSPLFQRLTSHLDETGWQQLCQPVDQASLPAASPPWIPATISHDQAQAMHQLRQCKQLGLRHLIWWELGLHGDIERSYHAISEWAGALIDHALACAREIIAKRSGRLAGGRFAVIGLGKLGGHELNLGSDVDLLFLWEADGMTSGGRKQLSAEEYFAELARMLIRLLSEQTGDGRVWPVDMRLRPGGDGAPLALSLEATLNHYLAYGQTWERAMLIKARGIAGDEALGKHFCQEITPFIYRRYLDYSAVNALADMKRRIDAQAGKHPLGSGFDIKRGRGGIREIEFSIQSLQLLHGGKQPPLRQRGGRQALQALQACHRIDASEAARLEQAYAFWRRVEHAIQARQGEQTHRLPDDYAGYLEKALDETDIDAAMQHHSRLVHDFFRQSVLPLDATETETSDWLYAPPWDQYSQVDETRIQAFETILQRIRNTLDRGLLPERSLGQVRHILAIAIPRWLDDYHGQQALDAFADLLTQIAGRANWIDLLASHRGALDWLIGVLSASRYLSRYIVSHPHLLEWPLLAERGEAEIDHLCRLIDTIAADDDEEEALARLGHHVDMARIQCALLIDAGKQDVSQIGAWLADIADHAVRACLRLGRHQLGLSADFPFVALALGKHGSREMSLTSDLDMIFVLDEQAISSPLPERFSDSRDVAQRLGKRIIRQLSGQAPFGAGYQFDGRLRPSGSSGILVTTLKGFTDYQRHEAQTWEHQALCRARTVAGPDDSRRRLAAAIEQLLDQARDPDQLARDVLAMRQKMLAHLASREDAIINLKQDPGGLVDIEFLAQFARLAYGGEHRATLAILDPDNDRLPAAWREHGAFLTRTYLCYRQMENSLRVELWHSLTAIPATDDDIVWYVLRRHSAMSSVAQLQQTMRQTHDLFHKLIKPAGD